MSPTALADLIRTTVADEVDRRTSATAYRQPLLAFAAADDPRFGDLTRLTEFPHLLPSDLLPGAQAVICFFLPFIEETVTANKKDHLWAAREWGVAYRDTNALIGKINSRLIEVLGEYGVRAAAPPATGNFDPEELRAHWSHKSIAVMAGLGSFGLHRMVITDSGCAGRFGTLVIDAALPSEASAFRERCRFLTGGECQACLKACPAYAIQEDGSFNRMACWKVCLGNASRFEDLGDAVQCCGKCAVTGPCAIAPAV